MGLDTVEIVMGWEEALGVSLSDAEASSLRTPRLAVRALAAKLGAVEEVRPCLTQRAFHEIRRRLMEHGVPRATIRPEVKLKTLLRKPDRIWGAMTVGEAARRMTLAPCPSLKSQDDLWSRSEIREVVRSVVIGVTGCEDFHDDSDFIRDIGVD